MSEDETAVDSELDELQEHLLYLELPLRRAVVYSDDGGRAWVEAMPVILSFYPSITLDAYWNLTVTEHARLLKDALQIPDEPEDEEEGES